MYLVLAFEDLTSYTVPLVNKQSVCAADIFAMRVFVCASIHVQPTCASSCLPAIADRGKSYGAGWRKAA